MTGVSYYFLIKNTEVSVEIHKVEMQIFLNLWTGVELESTRTRVIWAAWCTTEQDIGISRWPKPQCHVISAVQDGKSINFFP